MGVVTWRRVALPLILLGGLVMPAGALARYDIEPSFSLTELYDDNIFYSPTQRERDLITRFSPGVQAGYESGTLTLMGRYRFDAELFARHSELNKAFASQEVALEARYRPNRLLTLALDVNYVDTHTPSDLNVTTAIVAGRAHARRFSLDTSLERRFDGRTTGTIGYTFTNDEVAGGLGNHTHAVDLAVDREITTDDAGSLRYLFQEYIFEGDETVVSHTFTAGWMHRFSRSTSVLLRGGPRVSAGSIDAEGLAAIHYEFTRAGLSLTYARSQTTVIGQAGLAETDSFTVAVNADPVHPVHLKATAGYVRSTFETYVAKVYEANFEAVYDVSRWLSLTGSYRFSRQHGLDPASLNWDPNQQTIVHNVALLKVVVTYPSASTKPAVSPTPGEQP